MGWRILPLLMLFGALAHFNRVSISVAGAEQIIPSGALSESQMGYVYSGFLLLYTLSMIPCGWAIDRYGAYRAWVVLGFASALGLLLTGLVGWLLPAGIPLLIGLLLVRAPMGLANAPLHPAAARLVSSWFPAEGVSFANGLVTAACCLGMASTYPLFGSLIDHFGWPGACWLTGGVTVVVAGLWWWFGADSPVGRIKGVPAAADSHATGFSLLRDPSLLCLTLSYSSVGYFQYLFFYWAEYYFETVLGLSKEIGRRNASLMTLLMGVGMALGGWLSDRAVRRFGPRLGLALVPVGGLLVGAAATVVGTWSPDPNLAVIPFALAMAAIGTCEAPFWTTAVRLGGPHGGLTAGILNTGGNAVAFLAPTATPIIAEHFGWGAGLQVAAAFCLIGALFWIGVRPGRFVEPSMTVNGPDSVPGLPD